MGGVGVLVCSNEFLGLEELTRKLTEAEEKVENNGV